MSIYAYLVGSAFHTVAPCPRTPTRLSLTRTPSAPVALAT